MVTWVSDGYVSGVARKSLTDLTGTASRDAAVFDSLVGRLATNAVVDAQIVTRIQYNVPFGTVNPAYDILDGIRFTLNMSFASGDFPAAIEEVSMGVYLVKADRFVVDDALVVPSVTAILNDSTTVLFPAPGGLESPGSGGFSVNIDNTSLEPNTKYWALVCAIGRQYKYNDLSPWTPRSTNLARAISFWTNRTPKAPTITSPVSGSVITAGKRFTLAFKSNDPDALPSAPNDQRPWSFADLAGLQVQYAPRPTADTPEPEWIDLPIASASGEVGRGWFIEYADGGIANDGARQFRNKGLMKVLAGSPLVGPYDGIIPAGNWQIRMRTFDYGHALSTVRKTNSALAGYGPLGTKGYDSPTFTGEGPFPAHDYTPATYPAVNTSPWSTPVNVVVSSQVPAAVPISPANRLAVPVANPISLRWQYRNTHIPTLPQEARQVQIRKVGEATWTDLVSGNQSSAVYPLDGSQPVLPGPPAPEEAYEYISNVGFEDGTIGNWMVQALGSTTAVLSVSPDAHSGSYALRLDNPNAPLGNIIYQRIDIRPEDKFFTMRGWIKVGDSDTIPYVSLTWTDAGNTTVLGTNLYNTLTDPQPPGWWYVEFADVAPPVGATRVLVSIGMPNNTLINDGDLIDDFSFKGSPTKPVIAPSIPDLDLPVIAPTPYAVTEGTEYEWRVRVADTDHVVSAWSAPARFWVVPNGGSGPGISLPLGTIEGATLGCGKHRVEVYRRGGLVKIGSLTQVSYLDWGRLRDDISDAKVIVSGWDIDCGNLLARLKTWAYEVRIWRDNGFNNDLVWEGPVTLLTYENDKVTIQAKDVNVWPYRKIIRQAMNDSGSAGGDTVVNRAARIIQNVMAADDPNLLRYLVVITNDDDAVEYRNLPPFSRTAYEEIDDMAANAGLDYTAVGRSIIFWSTKHRIGTLPEFRDEHLGSSPIVSEYGMSAANFYSVSDGNGTHGDADRLDENGEDEDYGVIEVLSSSWASDSESDTGTYTEEGLETVRESFAEYAEKSIASKWPPPVVVRIPDNTTLNPNTPVSIQHLIPGVVVPLRATSTLRSVVGNQKLDSVKVVETEDGETISITLSPFNRDDGAIDGGGETA